jgi:GNAT superfamily N-acetyltransferase
VSWWSQWAKVTWLGVDAWLIESDTFDEYFMNRAGFLECDGDIHYLVAVERRFMERGRAPHLFVQESCTDVVSRLISTGYKSVDSMSVVVADRVSLDVNPGVKVEVANKVGTDDWAKVYLQSFYGDQGLEEEVRQVLEKLRNRHEESTLLTARIGGDAAGVLAMHRTPGLLGIYCVGTLPEFRAKGVAATLLNSALSASRNEGRRVVLQVIMSDGYEPYYIDRGFRRLYLKTLFRKEPQPVPSE